MEFVILDVPKMSMEEFSTPISARRQCRENHRDERSSSDVESGLDGHNQLKTTPGAKGVVLGD